MDLEQEVIDIFEAVCHAGQPFDLIVYAFGNSCGDITDEIVEEEMAFPDKLVPQFYEGRDLSLIHI